MSLEADLLARICREPDDTATRLVYADKLIERGDPRGAFISQQCRLDALDPLDVTYAPLLASTLRLEALHGRAWVGLDLRGAKFVRGFLERIAMRPADIGAHWDALAAREPIAGIDLLVGEDLPEPYRALTQPRSFRVLEVSPDSWFTAHSVGNVLAWGMPALVDLDLSGCDVGPTGARLLANLDTDLAGSFPGFRPPPPFARGQLRRLVLDGCGIGDQGARELFAADTVAGLEDLDLGQCRIKEPETLSALRNSPHVHGLRALSIVGNNGLVGHLGALAGWSVLPRLERFAPLKATTLAELTTLFPRASARLRRLDLSSAKDLWKFPAKVVAIAESLTHVDAGTGGLGDDGWAELIASPSVRHALEVRANGCSLSDDAVAVLTASKLERLVTLDLSSNKLSDDGLAGLAAWSGIENLVNLRIGNNRRVTAAGHRALMRAPRFVPARLDIGKSSDKTLVAELRERFGDALIVSS